MGCDSSLKVQIISTWALGWSSKHVLYGSLRGPECAPMMGPTTIKLKYAHECPWLYIYIYFYIYM